MSYENEKYKIYKPYFIRVYMAETLNLVIGVVILILGVPIGNYLAKLTKEELKSGQKWFKLIIFICLIGAVISLIYRNDIFLFEFLFIAIVTSRSLRIKMQKSAPRNKFRKISAREK